VYRLSEAQRMWYYIYQLEHYSAHEGKIVPVLLLLKHDGEVLHKQMAVKSKGGTGNISR